MDDQSQKQALNKTSLSDTELAEEIAQGNQNAETLFYNRFRPGLLIMLTNRTKDSARAEDLAQDTLLTVLAHLRERTIDNTAFLNRYVQQTAKYKHIGWLRVSANQTELRETIDDEVIDHPSAIEILTLEQRRKAVRDLIDKMPVIRDRELLYRYYVRDQSKPYVCEALQLSSTNFDRVISRARIRFKALAIEEIDHD